MDLVIKTVQNRWLNHTKLWIVTKEIPYLQKINN